jgi:hypothetical protein
VKLSTTRQSTTATPGISKISAIRRPLAVLGLVSSPTFATFPTAVHFLGHSHPVGAAVLGLAPAVPLVLPLVTLTVVYLMCSALAIATAAGRILLTRKVCAADCIDDLLGQVVNMAVALLTLTTYKKPARATRPRTPLPAADPSAPVFSEVAQHNPDVVSPESHGRHAKANQAPALQSIPEPWLPAPGEQNLPKIPSIRLPSKARSREKTGVGAAGRAS